MQYKNNSTLVLIAIFTLFFSQISNLAFAEDENESEVPVWALDGATATSVETQKPLYQIGGATATLKRNEHKIKIKVDTAGLPLGAYTNWWILYNQPSNCAAAVCQLSDLFNPNTDASILWAAGAIIEGKKAHFKAKLSVGEIPGQLFFGDGLTNALGAQVQYIIKWHGPTSEDPDVLYDQLHNIADPNCETAPLPGLTGLGRCPDLQASDMFMP
ncbi:hypothetical protein MNBD_NITROSPIRAE01-1612 [hydrothermal vent metagenome]|uniref:Uncharacterized protein n=1 Tax=hydrothermal vent metagenome TaxID=652676 RepID=A0A3B1CU65_9ZZZZ